VVTRLALAEIFAIYEVREALEGIAARLAAQNSQPGSWQYWVEQFKLGGTLHDHVESGEVEAYFGQYDRLRAEIVIAANNPVLAAMLDGILEKTRMIMRRVQILPGRAKQALAEHRAVVDALNAADPDEAERLRRENIRSAVATLRRFQYFVV
jgi:DNA-binding GntR family transcriptional regulator